MTNREIDAAWDSAEYNARRAEKAEAEVERLRSYTQGQMEEIARRGEELERLRALLREIQWGEKNGKRVCAVCKGWERKGHKRGCVIRAALGEE